MNSATRLLVRQPGLLARRFGPAVLSTHFSGFPPPLARIPQWHHARSLATKAVPATLYTTQDSRFANDKEWWTTLLAGGVTAAALWGSTTSSSSCEEQQDASSNEEKERNEDLLDPENIKIGPDDPYYTVPEEDEPTDCSMCLTFRQGPCRLDWKRFELCVKDKSPPKDKDGEDSNTKMQDSDPTACMKYAMPFYQCSSKHVNTYLILGNDQTQKTVTEPLMKAYNEEKAQSRRLCFVPNTTDTDNAVSIDWTQWETFVTTWVSLGGSMPSSRFELEGTGFTSPADALRASWKNETNSTKDSNNPRYLMMDGEGEPFLVTITAKVPLQQPLAGKATKKKTTKKKKKKKSTPIPASVTAPLMMTYALDQNGNLIGDARNTLQDEKKDNGDNTNEKDQKEEETPTHLPLQIQVVPGVTQEITIFALYVPKDGDFVEDGTLYESKPYKLQAITEKAAAKAKEEQKDKEEEAAKKEEAK